MQNRLHHILPCLRGETDTRAIANVHHAAQRGTLALALAHATHTYFGRTAKTGNTTRHTGYQQDIKQHAILSIGYFLPSLGTKRV